MGYQSSGFHVHLHGASLRLVQFLHAACPTCQLANACKLVLLPLPVSSSVHHPLLPPPLVRCKHLLPAAAICISKSALSER